MIIAPIVTAHFIRIHKEAILNQNTRNNFFAIFQDLRLRRPLALWVPVLFQLKRILFSINAVFLFQFPGV